MDCSFLSQEGRVALITGGSRGIGKSIALAFADAGADIALSARKLPDLVAGRFCLFSDVRQLGLSGLEPRFKF